MFEQRELGSLGSVNNIEPGLGVAKAEERLSVSVGRERSSGQTCKPANVLLIEPSRGWVSLKLGEIWEYRELHYFLTWRDVKVRYKQTALGAAWAILQPLFMMLIFTIFFGRLAGVGSSGIPYPLFALAGLVPWTFFSNAITASGNSLVGSAHLITKVYFPRLIVPAAAMLAGLVDFLLAFLLLCLLMVYYRVAITVQILF